MKKPLLDEEPFWRHRYLYMIVLPAVMPYSVTAFVLLAQKSASFHVTARIACAQRRSGQKFREICG
jgi:hypothetical protein